MSLIYTPNGKAREYSPLALNIYNGCDFGCTYCYTKIIKRNFNVNATAIERKNFIDILQKELKKYTYKEQILLSFMCDPYCHKEKETRTTEQALDILNENNCLVAILTKSGETCLRDLDKFKAFGSRIKIGSTLTLTDDTKSQAIEPRAALPTSRLEMLKVLHENKIKTFVSIEPVIDTKESLKLMELTLPFVDQYKIGKMNYFEKNYDIKNDWTQFLKDSVKLMRENKKDFYIKLDLQKFDQDNILTDQEKDMNYLNLPLFNSEKLETKN